MSRPQRTFQDDESIPGYSSHAVLPLLYDQEGEDEVVGEIGREGCLHPDGVQK
ncbi:MAG: hypothetical protein AAFQ58_16665 [Pseudomonadota bacterium]